MLKGFMGWLIRNGMFLCFPDRCEALFNTHSKMAKFVEKHWSLTVFPEWKSFRKDWTPLSERLVQVS